MILDNRSISPFICSLYPDAASGKIDEAELQETVETIAPAGMIVYSCPNLYDHV